MLYNNHEIMVNNNELEAFSDKFSAIYSGGTKSDMQYSGKRIKIKDA